MSKRKKIIYFLSIFLFITLASFSVANAKAHAPMYMDLAYDMDTDTMDVSFVHGVTDPNYHYVKIVQIFINHSHTPIVNQSYSSQPTKNIFTYNYNFVANFNATIEVIATCSLEGALVKEMHVGIFHPEPKGSFSSVIAPTIGATVIVFTIIAIPWLNKKIRKRK